MIPYKFNPLGVSNKKSNNISSFKIQGNSLTNMYITTVEDCVVDFGDGTTQTFTGNNITSVRHNYSEWDIYTIKITGNHSTFRASTNTIEIIQISNSITNCSHMFSTCSITEIPSTLTIPNSVTDCSVMFANCSKITTIPSTFTIPNSVTNCSLMFSYCSSLTSIPSTFTLGNSVTDCSDMFSNCSGLTAISLTFTIPNSVTNCARMFDNCSITEIPETFTLGNSVTDCSGMFRGCSSLTAIPETLIIPNSVTDCAYMFRDCRNLTSDISNIWPSAWNYTGAIFIDYMFYNCSKVVGTVPADKLWNSGKTFFSSGCFTNCTSLTNYDDIPAGWKS